MYDMICNTWRIDSTEGKEILNESPNVTGCARLGKTRRGCNALPSICPPKCRSWAWSRWRGGRLQVRSDALSPTQSETSPWKNDKGGVLWTLQSQTQAVDPGPEIPECWVDPPRASKRATEVSHATMPEGEISPRRRRSEDPKYGVESSLFDAIVTTLHFFAFAPPDGA